MLKLPCMQPNNRPVSRKKVCYVVTKGVWGGAQKYVYNLAVLLPKEDFDVLVITGDGEILQKKLEEKGVRVLKIKSMRRNISILREILSFFKLFWIIFKEKPDVIHLNSPKAGGLGSVIGRILFVPKIIYTVHGFTWNEDRKTLEKTLITFFSWITILLCHRTITIAKKEELQAKNLPLIKDEKINFIKNGVEKIEFKDRKTAREELSVKIGSPLPEDIIVLGTLAELHKNKGLEYALDAVRKINTSFKYLIIGEGEERKRLEYFIKKYTLEDKVYLVGFVDKANEYLKAFDIFMLTSIKEGLPFTVLEAGLAELPVIASSIGGIPDAIDNGKNGILVTKEKSGEITRAIEYLVNKPEERKTFGEKLKEKVEKEFSVEKMLIETKDLYI